MNKKISELSDAELLRIANQAIKMQSTGYTDEEPLRSMIDAETDLLSKTLVPTNILIECGKRWVEKHEKRSMYDNGYVISSRTDQYFDKGDKYEILSVQDGTMLNLVSKTGVIVTVDIDDDDFEVHLGNDMSCNYCEEDEALCWENDKNNAFIDDEGHILATVDGKSLSFNVEYCPKCGKRFE